jgi:hypothetical protein
MAQGQPSTQMQKHTPIAGIVGTMLAIIAWLVFILFYALYWSNGFSLFQNIIVTIVSLLITGMVIGLVWVVWGWKRKWMFDEYGWESPHKKE